MADYLRDFMGTPARLDHGAGLDPNYGDHYRGMRMFRDDRRAAYGSHRMTRRYDLGTEGGFRGRFGPGEGRRLPRDFDRRWEDRGSVHGSMEDPELLRHYNANSPGLAGPPHRRRLESGSERGHHLLPEPRWIPDRHYDPRYSNRGVSEAGYSEGWAWGPMRGAR